MRGKRQKWSSRRNRSEREMGKMEREGGESVNDIGRGKDKGRLKKGTEEKVAVHREE